MDAANVRKRIEQILQDMGNANDKMAFQHAETSQMMARASEDPEYLKDNIVAILSHQNRFIESKANFIAHALELQTLRVDILQAQFQLVLDAIKNGPGQDYDAAKVHAELEGLKQSGFKVN